MFKTTKTVDSILATFTKTLSELESHAETMNKAASRQKEIIKEAENKRDSFAAEMNKAIKVYQNLKNTLGV